MDDGDGAPGDGGTMGRGQWARFRAGLRDEVVRRTAEGETLRGICARADMPDMRTVEKWMAADAAFASEMHSARAAAGRGRFGCVGSYCQATAEAIFDRMCEGDSLARVCRAPDMPAISTAYRWMKDQPEFREAVLLAWDICGERLADAGWQAACEATPETAYATRVKLEQLRWYAGKLGPRRFGPFKATEPAGGAAGAGAVTNVYLRTFIYPREEGEEAQPSGRPDQLIYSAQAGATPGEAPQVTWGPASGAAQKPLQEDRDRAWREACEAARAAGMERFNGGVPTRFFPDWFREKHPQVFADSVDAERFSARARIKAMASHGCPPEPEDLIKAGWTAEEAAERHPPVGPPPSGD